jgi:hypothetical protein
VSQSAARFVRQRRSLERAGFYIEDAIAASRRNLAGGLRGKFDEMPRRLIAGAAVGRFGVRLAVAPEFFG